MANAEDPTTPTTSPGDAHRVAQLEADLAAARDDAQRNHDRWVRERADLENAKRRAARERTEALRYGVEPLVRDLLPVVDNLERALRAAAGGADAAGLLDGVRLVLKGLADVLERHGVSRVEAHGAPFDPTFHEAVAHLETALHAPNTVMEEHQTGYRLHDRLLRPALVSVAKSPPGAAGNLANEEGGD